MLLVTNFESGASEDELSNDPESKFSFDLVVDALSHSLEIAENVFARCAKRKFKALVKAPFKYVLPGEDIGEDFWSATVSVTMSESAVSVPSLESLVETMSCLIPNKGDDIPILLIGALSTKISEVGGGKLSFSLKQRWRLGKK